MFSCFLWSSNLVAANTWESVLVAPHQSSHRVFANSLALIVYTRRGSLGGKLNLHIDS